MRRYAIIATRYPKEVRGDGTTTVGALYGFLTRAGWEVNFVEGADSMFDVYDSTVKRIGLTAEDQVILCHDDIELLVTEEIFNEILDNYLTNPRTGFVGVAGCAHISREHVSWFETSQHFEGAGGGVVYHGKSVVEMQPSFYGPAPIAVCMDGQFLATTGKVLNTINLKMPPNFVGRWDWYDAIYTFQAYKKKLTNVIAPILLRHESGGRYPKEWYLDKPKFLELFDDHIPATARL
jgi:hypothetical protein